MLPENFKFCAVNVKELLSPSRHEIKSLSEYNCTLNQNHLAGKETQHHLDKLAKPLSSVLSTYLYNAFYCMFLSCHVRVPE